MPVGIKKLRLQEDGFVQVVPGLLQLTKLDKYQRERMKINLKLELGDQSPAQNMS